MDGDYKDEPPTPPDLKTDDEESNELLVSDFDTEEDLEIIFSNTMDEQLYSLVQIIKCLDERLTNHQNLEDNEIELILHIEQDQSLELSLFSLEILNTYLSDNKKETNPFFSDEICDTLQTIIENSHEMEKIYASLKCANSMTQGQGQNHFKLNFDFILLVVSRGFEIVMTEGLDYIHNDNIQICCLSILSKLANIQFPNEAVEAFGTKIVPYLKNCLDNDATCTITIELITTLIQKNLIKWLKSLIIQSFL
ncbi:hypothetical protein TVAG_066040 [Trichomonas vaginalis G3]|uniref:Uncharacterized protein n=1 Tax=Trichomonas vaginalis (strain ATCC PRA-98 / G3) TaxID=412133 RepID=A2EM08_TRIV3|nr:armadillo (ARM) repeat-containing protein family [Trichomonas vaginalis G3]EAY06347.1 hypothetical protein TVAG_066040 [Trichomonas vaginalis G3]KAI5489887.1 armadillo (ARM) repeat-containing protein family [Trichomonas vaginalis G3]|eukprot:XP_001318570.1 hypothetical protein [Trichomonas vaginalis G3]